MLVGTTGITPREVGVAVMAIGWVATVEGAATVISSGAEPGSRVRENKEPMSTTPTTRTMSKRIRTANDKVGFVLSKVHAACFKSHTTSNSDGRLNLNNDAIRCNSSPLQSSSQSGINLPSPAPAWVKPHCTWPWAVREPVVFTRY